MQGRRGGIPLRCDSGRCGRLLGRGRIMVRSGRRSGRSRPSSVSSQESAEVRKLRAEVRELRRANEVLKAAAGFFAAEHDRPHTIL